MKNTILDTLPSTLVCSFVGAIIFALIRNESFIEFLFVFIFVTIVLILIKLIKRKIYET